jgi:hypothetical protein
MPEVAVRKRLLIVAGVALAAAVIVPAALELPAYRQKLARGRLIDPAHCKRIKAGMSRAEVEAILGGPPGDFRTENVGFLVSIPAGDWVVSVERSESWVGDEGRIAVVFDEQGRVRGRGFGEATRPTPPSLTEQARAWLRRHWP